MSDSLDLFSRNYWDLAQNFRADLFGYRDFQTFRDEGVAPETAASSGPAPMR